MFRIEDARAVPGPSGVTLEFAFAAGDLRFRPVVEFAGLRADEAGRVVTATAQRMIRALAIVEAFSYWKALCSPVIEVALPAPDAAELDWWQAFWPGAMGEFFYRNQIDYTAPGFLVIQGPAGGTAASAGAGGPGGPGTAGDTADGDIAAGDTAGDTAGTTPGYTTAGDTAGGDRGQQSPRIGHPQRSSLETNHHVQPLPANAALTSGKCLLTQWINDLHHNATHSTPLAA